MNNLNIPHIQGLPEGVQASVRRSGDAYYLFLINFTSGQTIVLDWA